MNLHWSQIPQADEPARPLEIGGWSVLRSQNRVVRGEEEIVLEPKVMDLLLRLAAAEGETVSRDDLLSAVWPGVYVADDSLYRAVSLLRRAFEDYPELSDSIVTVPRRGYRFAAPLVPAAQDPTAPGGGAEARDSAPGVAPRPWRRRGLFALAAGLLGAIGMALGMLSLGANDPSADAVRVRPFTSYPGQERAASFSPDGTQVAFSWQGQSGSNWDIYVKGIDEETPRRLTTSPGADVGAAWSPSGGEIAYVSLQNGNCRINIVSLAGRTRELRRCIARSDTELAWAPDGRLLYFSDRVGQTGPLAIHALRLADGRVRQVTFPAADTWGDHTPTVSPSGDLIAFARSPAIGVTDVWTVPTAGGSPRRITDDSLKIHGVAWSSDGREILFSSNRGGLFALWRASRDGGRPEPLLSSGLRGDSVDVAPAGGRLIFEDERVTTELWSYAADSSRAPAALSSTNSWDWHPVYSPSGRHLAFISDRSGSPELWIQNIGSGEARRLTHFAGAYLQSPAWSPDGSHLVFAAPLRGNFELYVVPADGSVAPRRMTLHPSVDQNPSWSRDGRHIYFTSRRTGPWEIWRLDLRSGHSEQVTTVGGFRAVEAEDGRLIFTPREGGGLFSLDPNTPGARPRRLAGDLAPLDWANWAVAGDVIYYSVRTPTETRIVRIAPDGTRNRIATLDEIPYHSGLAVSPDGRRLVFARTTVIQANLVLAEGWTR
jgi:Tol biopolymer transport system component/DNA-binding winged helix-turn-helix (wHTH) protein